MLIPPDEYRNVGDEGCANTDHGFKHINNVEKHILNIRANWWSATVKIMLKINRNPIMTLGRLSQDQLKQTICLEQ